MKPFADFGIAIRLRYIDKTRHQPSINNTFVADGNQAAHGANLAAYMALFDAGILPDNGEHARIFEELYGCRLITMRTFPKSLARAVACRKSWEGEVNRGRSNPSLQELVQYGKMLYSALKEASERARIAAVAEKLTFEEFTESTAKKLDEDERSWVLVE